MITYPDVKAIVETLVTQGVHLSRKRVRAELGHVGSFETIGALIDQAMAELGLQEAGEDREDGAGSSLLEPDPAAVAMPQTA